MLELRRTRATGARATTAWSRCSTTPLDERREELIEALKAEGVGTSVYYPKPLPDTRYYRETYGYARRVLPGGGAHQLRLDRVPGRAPLEEGDVERSSRPSRRSSPRRRTVRGWTVAGKRIALVGGAGFIGHHLALRAERARRRGPRDRRPRGQQPPPLHGAAAGQTENRDLYLRDHQPAARQAAARPGSRCTSQDARDYHALSRMLGEIQPQVIVHLAAVAHAGQVEQGPDEHVRPLACARSRTRSTTRATSAEHFVFFSSSMVYGNFLSPRSTEDHPLDPIGIYGALKLAGEKIVIAYQQVFDLTTRSSARRPSTARAASAAGSSQVFIESALVGATLRVDGDGDERLDFSYVDDVVDGVIRAIGQPGGAQRGLQHHRRRRRARCSELIEIVQEHFPEVEVEYVERDALRPFRGTLSIDKARQLIGYEPADDARGRARPLRRLVPRPDLGRRPRRQDELGLTVRAVALTEDPWLSERFGHPVFSVESTRTRRPPREAASTRARPAPPPTRRRCPPTAARPRTRSTEAGLRVVNVGLDARARTRARSIRARAGRFEVREADPERDRRAARRSPSAASARRASTSIPASRDAVADRDQARLGRELPHGAARRRLLVARARRASRSASSPGSRPSGGRRRA